MRASLRTSGAIFARAASVRGASIATAGAAGAQSPPHDESIVDEEALKKRAEYRAWRTGAAKYQNRPGVSRRPDSTASSSLLQTELLGDCKPLKLTPPPRILNEFSAPSMLGRGGFGAVFAASSDCDGRRYALKIVPAPPKGSGAMPPAEARCMASLPPHQHLVRYHSCWREEGHSLRQLRNLLAEAGPKSSPVDDLGEFEGGEDADDDEAGCSDSSDSSSCGSSVDWFSSLVRESRSAMVMQMELITYPTLQAVLRSEMPGGGGHLYSSASTLGGVPGVMGGIRPNGSASAAADVRWRWVAGVASGLHAMHSAGWVHMDVKPANIFCGPGGEAKLGDFGLAVPLLDHCAGGGHAGDRAGVTGGEEGVGARAGDAQRETEHGSDDPAEEAGSEAEEEPSSMDAAGTLLYMAPERFQRRPAAPSRSSGAVSADAWLPSAASDVYSLGVCVAEIHGSFQTLMERAHVLGELKEECAAPTQVRGPTRRTLDGGGDAGAQDARNGPSWPQGSSSRAPRRRQQGMAGALGPTTDPGKLSRQMLAAQPEKRPLSVEVEAMALEYARKTALMSSDQSEASQPGAMLCGDL